VVVLLIYLTLYVLRRWQVGRPGRLPRQVTILETTRLSPRQALHLVQVGKQVMLIGATDNSLALLSEEVELVEAGLQEPELPQPLSPLGAITPLKTPALAGFGEILNRASKAVRMKNQGSPASEAPDA
jgi:flagellar biogenesis protein FliO